MHTFKSSMHALKAKHLSHKRSVSVMDKNGFVGRMREGPEQHPVSAPNTDAAATSTALGSRSLSLKQSQMQDPLLPPPYVATSGAQVCCRFFVMVLQ
jgi:hypothetical protein